MHGGARISFLFLCNFLAGISEKACSSPGSPFPFSEKQAILKEILPNRRDGHGDSEAGGSGKAGIAVENLVIKQHLLYR